MLTQINDIEKLPKRIIYNNEILFLNINTCTGFFTISYSNILGISVIAVNVFKCQNIDIDYNYGVGSAITIEEAVNMLYEYVMNNPDIEVEE